MDLEQVAAAIRPRTHWEAMDLGVAMARRWNRPLLLAWCVCVLPIAITIGCLVESPWTWLLLWWLKPVFDRVPLFVLSRALFGAVPRVSETLLMFVRVPISRIAIALTWRRLDPMRSFQLPIVELEGLTGERAARRRELLRRTCGGKAITLTTLCAILEQSLLLAGVALLYWLTPDARVEETFGWMNPRSGAEAPAWLGPLLYAIGFCALTIVEPVYVACGFAMYLNRRTLLEGWDVELALRRLAQRVARKRPVHQRIAGALLALFCCAAVGYAQEEPERVIQRVLEAPEFQTKKTVREWVPDTETRANKTPFGDLLGALAAPVLWALALAAVGMLVWMILRRVNDGRRSARGVAEPPEQLFGLDIRPESLPDDPAAEAWRLFECGEPARGLALLYRGALAHLVTARGVAIPISSTEGDCARIVSALPAPELVRYFAELTGSWQNCAYAHRMPGSIGARTLCDAWPAHFAKRVV